MPIALFRTIKPGRGGPHLFEVTIGNRAFEVAAHSARDGRKLAIRTLKQTFGYRRVALIDA